MTALLGIAGVLLALYGCAVAAIGSGTKFFLVWFALGALCLGLAGGRALGVWGSLPAGALRAFLAALFAAAAILAVCTGLILSGFGARGREGLDYLIVLGAQVREDGPSRVLRYRLDTAAAYLEQNEGTLCIVSGGQGYNEPFSEAEGMRRYLEEKGIAPERIIPEDKSENTSRNIENSMKLIPDPDASVGIVTNNFHLYRAMKIARKKGLKEAAGIAAESSPFYLPNNMLRECLGIIKDMAAGNL